MNIALDIILPYAMSYFVFFALLLFCKRHNSNRLADGSSSTQSGPLLISLHVAGIFLFGIIPFFSRHLSSPLNNNLHALGKWPLSVLLMVALLMIIIFSNFAGKKEMAPVQSFRGNNGLNYSFLATYCLLRICFIAAYETWFRGFFLNDCIVALGLGGAVAVNLGLYALLHVVNRKEEAIACIPFGLLLCFLCIWQQAVWPAIVVHLALTISYEAYIVRKLILNKLQHVDFNNRGIWLHRK
ncbi:MAG TPA: CPBP family intramembrane glutamic endopeptidase [Chryseolinea sp.]|nr:CPBP family intramembrane glutamic endopeptidase [Chryseolinea sp.]